MNGVTEKRERVTVTLLVEHSKPWSRAHADAVDSALAGLSLEVEGDIVVIDEVDDIRRQTPEVAND